MLNKKLKNTIEDLRYNDYGLLKECIFITIILETSLITGEVLFGFGPIILGTGIAGQASLLAIGGGLLLTLPPLFEAIHSKVFRSK
jgi:hypothetical protein